MKLKEEFRNLDIPEEATYLKDGFYFKLAHFFVWLNDEWKETEHLDANSPAYKASRSLWIDEFLYEEEPKGQEPEIKKVPDLTPKWLWLEIRRDRIISAITRSIEANKTPLPEWYEELKSILCKIEFDKKTGD